MGNIRGDQGGILGGGDMEAETWRMRTSRSSKKGRGWEKGRRGFQTERRCPLPLTPPARVKVTQPPEAPVPPSSPACDSGRIYPEGERPRLSCLEVS